MRALISIFILLSIVPVSATIIDFPKEVTAGNTFTANFSVNADKLILEIDGVDTGEFQVELRLNNNTLTINETKPGVFETDTCKLNGEVEVILRPVINIAPGDYEIKVSLYTVSEPSRHVPRHSGGGALIRTLIPTPTGTPVPTPTPTATTVPATTPVHPVPPLYTKVRLTPEPKITSTPIAKSTPILWWFVGLVFVLAIIVIVVIYLKGVIR